MPYISNFKTQKVLKEVISYTADKTCMVYVQCVSNNKLYGTIIVRVGEYYVFQCKKVIRLIHMVLGSKHQIFMFMIKYHTYTVSHSSGAIFLAIAGLIILFYE